MDRVSMITALLAKRLVEGTYGGKPVKWIGITTTTLYDGATTNPITINGSSVTAVEGNMVSYSDDEFIFNGTAWQSLGSSAGLGDMLKAVYDTDDDGVVEAADNATTVNGHTVGKDVPADAVFTDTVYDDTSISNRVSAIENVVPSDATTSNKLATQSDIPSLTDYVQKSQTAGLLKNDGTVDTNTYAQTSALSDYIAKSQTAGLMKNDGTVDTNSYATTSALSDYISKSNTSGLMKNDGTVDTTIIGDVSGIKEVIPSSATSSNKLATQSDLPSAVVGNPSGSSTAGNLSKLQIGNDIYDVPSGGSGNTISKTRYQISSSSWSSSPNADGYYTLTVSLNPAIGSSPDVYVAGSADGTQPTDTEKGQFAYVKRCKVNGTTLTLYASSKPSSTFYIWVEGVNGTGSGDIVGNVIQPNGAVSPYRLSTSEAVFTGRYWTDGKRIMQRVFSFNAWASETHDNIIYMHSWDKTMFSSINYVGNYIRLISMEWQNAQYVYDMTESNGVSIASFYVDTNTGNLVFQIHVPSSWLNKPVTLLVEYSER